MRKVPTDLCGAPIAPIKNVPLAEHLNIGVGGRVRYFFEPKNEKELSLLLKFLYNGQTSFFILGGGTNLVAREKIRTKAVISMNKMLGFSVSDNVMTAFSGVSLPKIVMRAAHLGLSGLEPLAGIPGTVGGAVFMNAGGKYGDISRVVREIDAYDALGRKRTFQRSDMNFSYRRGPFSRRIVTRVVLGLEKKKGDSVLQETKRILKEKGATQPLGSRSAGCVFLNPPGVSAGKLIDEAGLKGLRLGGASVSDVHANYIVTDRSATSADVFGLMDKIKKTVLDKFGIKLKAEVITIE